MWSPPPSPGVPLTDGNRQIRTTPPPLARGGTPVIAGGAVGLGPPIRWIHYELEPCGLPVTDLRTTANP